MPILTLRARHYQMVPPEKPKGYIEQKAYLNTDKTALLVVDIYGKWSSQNSNFGQMSSLLSLQARRAINDIVINRIRPSLEAARKVDIPVIYISQSAPRIALSDSEYAKQMQRRLKKDMQVLYQEDCVDYREYHKGKVGVLSYTKLVAPQTGDYFIRKMYYSGFYDTRLDALLRNLGVKSIVCLGFAVNVCLQCTMIDGLYHNYEVFLLRDCTWEGKEPSDASGQVSTQGVITWIEAYIGRSIHSQDFINACLSIKRGSS